MCLKPVHRFLLSRGLSSFAHFSLGKISACPSPVSSRSSTQSYEVWPWIQLESRRGPRRHPTGLSLLGPAKGIKRSRSRALSREFASDQEPSKTPSFVPSKSGDWLIRETQTTTERSLRVTRCGRRTTLAALSDKAKDVLDDQSKRGQVLKLSERKARIQYPELVVFQHGYFSTGPMALP